jgi:hypothetical protein
MQTLVNRKKEFLGDVIAAARAVERGLQGVESAKQHPRNSL